MNDIIHWEQAYQHFEHNKKENVERVKHILWEIETSNFCYLNAIDIHYYADTLNEYSNRKDEKGKLMPYTANEVRRINMKARNISSFDLINTFADDDTDDIIDFF